MYFRRTMVLSVIIVSYNVRYFTEQCLCSVQRAMYACSVNNQEVQVLVVDNNSEDGSLEYLQARFPFVQFIANKENTGFARANNLALQQSIGKYVLFLNPDTIIPEDCFTDCIAFMESKADAGALGVRMIDGSGQYLPESKRGFPSPRVSFCKMTGLTRLFPTSKLFARYYMGHLPSNKDHAVDVLAGAFMLVKKDVLRQTGGFDEQFFMYAEDIDLSYRIQQAGYTNYYFSGCTIIHFKGESTRKDARYIKLFYKAMIQFVRKHYRGTASWWYVKLLEMAIGLKAAFSVGANGSTTSSFLNYTSQLLHATGDAGSREEISALLASSGHHQLVVPSLARGVIYCEGPGYPFKAIIGQLANNRITGFIHGLGTTNAVASHSKEQQGAILIPDETI